MTDIAIGLEQIPGWQAICQPPTRLRIEAKSDGLRLLYDFRDSGGFLVARLPLTLHLSERFAFACDLKGKGQTNQFEFKLVDNAGNCWRFVDEHFKPDTKAKRLYLTQDDFAFAWGPAGFGAPEQITAIEIALVAIEGGQGSLLLQGLHFQALGPAPRPKITTSSQAADWHLEDWWAGKAPWQPAPQGKAPWIALDFGEATKLCGLRIQWQGEGADTSIEASPGQGNWRPLAQGLCPAGQLSHFWLGEVSIRRLRIRLARPAAIAAIDWLKTPAMQTPGISTGLHQTLAQYVHWQTAKVPRGWYPRHLLREQSYWTCLGTAEGQGSALMNEEGQVELDGADACLDALLFVDGRLHGWDEALRTPGLEASGLPMPRVRLDYQRLGLRLEIEALALHQCLVVEYRLLNLGAADQRGQLMLALRPFQLTPLWQAGHRHFGGMGRLFRLAWTGQALIINDQRQLLPLVPPSRAGTSPSQRNEVIADLALGQMPPQYQAQDQMGWASAALSHDFCLAPGATFQTGCLIPFANLPTPQLDDLTALTTLDAQGRSLAAQLAWRSKLALMPEAECPKGLNTARQAALSARSAICHSLVQRQGQALQPGPRRYTRAWIRDGVIQCAALLRAGCVDEARRYLEWYAGHQAADGRIPCCIDTSEPKGPDWLVEHDSLGQFIFGIMECWRFSGDKAWLASLWPNVELALKALQGLLAGPVKNPLGRGLLPASASHEGYLAHPVQAYWDDFWALRGFRDALAMAKHLGKEEAASRIQTLLHDFETDLGQSLRGLIETRGLDHVPGSVDLADFDPSATATAIAWLDRLPGISDEVLHRTLDLYLAGFRKRRDNLIPWQQYSAYEIRIIQALVRLGRRDEAHELLDYFLAERRPPAWNQWPEITWHELRTPGHLGDLPHAWIGAEFFLAWQSLFAFERLDDQSLVIAAGIPDAWLRQDETIGIKGLRSYWGRLNISLERRKTGLWLELNGDFEHPVGGIHLQPPQRTGEQLFVNGRSWDRTSF